MTPSDKTVKLLRALHYYVERLERDVRMPNREKPGEFIFFKKDFGGFADYLAIGHRRVIFVQTTSSPNFNSRVNKIAETPAAQTIVQNGQEVICFGWYDDTKKMPRLMVWAGTWEAREETALTYLIGQQEEVLL